MTITKTTVGAEEGHIYKLNDVINYKITATNDGNLTLTNVKVEDALTGNVGENAFTIDILAPGEAQTFDVRYVVTENDVLEGKVINNATGTATDPTDPDESKTPITPGEKEDPIETPNPSLAVVKTSDKTGVVKLGETITYTITVTNNGNVTINDIEVTDELTGNTGDNAFTIDRLAVGETKQFTATYTVTEDDILEGTIVNRATAIGKDPRNEEVTGDGEVRVDTESTTRSQLQTMVTLHLQMFQVVVRFVAVNGTVSTDRAVVTLVDKNGKPAKDGVGHLTKNQIAAATANTGYDQSSLSWTPGEPTITYNITGEMTFTATPAPAPAPTEPTTPPARPTRPTTRTTAPTGNAIVENAVTPSEEKVEEKAAEIKEVLKSDDDKVPVANQKLDDLYSGDAKKDNPVI